MSSLNALQGFTMNALHKYTVPGESSALPWLRLGHTHQLAVVSVLAEYFHKYQEAGPGGSLFTSNMKGQLGGIKLKNWMSDEDVAVQARAPPSFPQWKRINKLTMHQEKEYNTWMAKAATDANAYKQEYDDNKGLTIITIITLITLILLL